MDRYDHTWFLVRCKGTFYVILWEVVAPMLQLVQVFSSLHMIVVGARVYYPCNICFSWFIISNLNLCVNCVAWIWCLICFFIPGVRYVGLLSLMAYDTDIFYLRTLYILLAMLLNARQQLRDVL